MDLNLLKQSAHFVPSGEVPQLKGDVNLSKIFEILASAKKGGGVLIINNEPKYYLKGEVLHSKMPGLIAKRMQNLKVSDLVVEAPEAFVRIDDSPTGATEATLRSFPDSVFVINNRAGDLEGFFLNQESILSTLTNRFARYCTKPKPKGPHLNYDNKTGVCSICNYPLEP